MTLLYLHGLESKLSETKRTILEAFATVIAPDMDYHNNPNVYQELLKEYKNETIDCIIGSSMGGFMGYHVAMTLGCPALLFNPALAKRSAVQNIPDTINPSVDQQISIVLGGKDEVVDPKTTLDYLSKHFNKTVQLQVKVRPELEHPIPLEIFEEECSLFLTRI
ncbi:YqiA/YcfP family alpha/beta fold hydrolase [Flavobacterium tegetincola]|uniref:YqiA/YcfP family alpha/beta fold hydrolase n=1 Tax=Flavobacterium tegetincola TaxID=150172 RepID=UPI000428C2A9|nr:YqiA/YcfP family alpha/beta fold hydrolase [Flavobacterium tegetincola]